MNLISLKEKLKTYFMIKTLIQFIEMSVQTENNHYTIMQINAYNIDDSPASISTRVIFTEADLS